METLALIISWFLVNPWASLLGLIITGVLLRTSKIKGYGDF